MNNAKLRSDLREIFTTNKTFEALLNKALPDSHTNALIKKAQASHNSFVKKAMLDTTKNDVQKRLVVTQNMNNILSPVLRGLDKDLQTSKSLQAHFEQNVQKEIVLNNTTRHMAASQYGALVQNLEYTEVVNLVRNGDVDAARAMELPILRAKFGLMNNDKKAETFHAITEKCVLGNKYEALTQTRKAVSALSNIGDSLMGQIEANGESIKNIMSNVVEPVEAA